MSETDLYEPLPLTGCIRLFMLHDPSDHEILSGTLRIVPLSEENLSYKALSYTWGRAYGSEHENDLGDARKDSIICNGKCLPVSENLHDALEQLCSRRNFCYIWVDAICINQDDDDERSEQIKLMAEIYSKADEVIIWLGQGDPESEEAIALICEHSALAFCAILDKKAYNFNDLELFERSNHRALNERQWKAILMLFRRRWFRRVWTLQEVALAKRAVAFCGAGTFFIDHATTFATFLVNNGWDQRLYHLGKEMPYGTSNGLGQAAIINEWIGCEWRGGTFGKANVVRLFYSFDAYCHASPIKIWLSALHILVQYMRCREVTDVRDKILASLALAFRFAPQTIIQAVKDLMDYRKTTELLYFEFTVFMITWSDSLDILSQVDGDKQGKYVKNSWVPDFSAPCSRSLIEGTPFNSSKNLGDFDCTGYKISPLSHLSVRGVTLGSITRIAEYWNKGNTVEAWCHVIIGITDWSRYKESRQEVLWRTLLTDRSGVHCPAPRELEDSFHCFMIAVLAEELNYALASGTDVDAFWQSRKAYKDFCCTETLGEARDKVEAVAHFIDQPTDVRVLALQFLNAHALACQSILSSSETYEKDFERAGGQLFMSSTGHLGLGPQLSKETDIVCFVQGARIPFILRPTDSHGYQLVGEAYVHGLMQGEISDLNLPLAELILE